MIFRILFPCYQPALIGYFILSGFWKVALTQISVTAGTGQTFSSQQPEEMWASASQCRNLVLVYLLATAPHSVDTGGLKTDIYSHEGAAPLVLPKRRIKMSFNCWAIPMDRRYRTYQEASHWRPCSLLRIKVHGEPFSSIPAYSEGRRIVRGPGLLGSLALSVTVLLLLGMTYYANKRQPELVH